jgi:hypothetical protein
MTEQNLNDILKDLKKTEEKIDIYIPSLKKDVQFTPLTLSQQKNIIDKITSSSFGIIDFYNSVYEVIKSSTTADLNTINTIDRINIILNFRKNINSIYENIDVNKVIERNKSVQLPELKKTIITDKFTFEVVVPSLVTDFKFNNYIITVYRDEKTLLGKLLVNELSKFITKFTINETNTIVDFSNVSIKHKFNFLEAIDSKHFKEVFEYVNLVRDTEVELVKIDDTQVEIGPELFIM